MPERPLLVLPRPEVGAASRRQAFPPGPLHYLSVQRQGQRLAPRFQALQQYFAQKTATLQATAAGAAAEEVIVFETISSVEHFIAAVRRIPGMEWLTEQEEDFEPDDDFFDPGHAGQPVPGRLFLVMSNQEAMRQLLALWNRYQANPTQAFDYGLANWKKLFAQLRDVRLWGVKDRLSDTGVLEYWREAVEVAGDERIRCEVELWHRSDVQKRAHAFASVSQALSHAQGQVLGQHVIDEIAYHGILVELPRASVAAILQNPNIDLVQSSEIMLFRPVGQSVFDSPTEDALPGTSPPAHELPTGSPTVALLDGLPIENHQYLAGRLIVDDPDEWAAICPPATRHHGTAMASLIVYNELDANQSALQHPVYVRPILKPNPNDWVNSPPQEGIPTDMLTLDLIHRAVRRIVQGEGGQPPVAPTVRVINLSVGDPTQPFDRTVSPWARLLDWLSWKYNVLFIVSAGNHAADIVLNVPRAQFSALRVRA